MPKINDKKTEVLSYIAAMRTCLDNYPTINSVNSTLNLMDTNTPMSLILSLLDICGVGEEKLLRWLSKMLCGQDVLFSGEKKKVGDKEASKIQRGEGVGFLDIIEEGIKALLLLNIKNMFTCTLNPVIPSDAVEKGITLPLQVIDMFSVLRHAPNSKRGKTMYFDNSYTPNELWKSRDFNCFLWYIINKSNSKEKYKSFWDNRCEKKIRKKIIESNSRDGKFTETFFKEIATNNSYVSEYNSQVITKKGYKTKPKADRTNFYLKKQFISLEYNEFSNISSIPDTITIKLNKDRYATPSDELYYIPYKTVFEFNYDYIYSLKLFDSKTIVGLIINSLLGILNSTGSIIGTTKYTFEQSVIAGKVSQIIRGYVNSPDIVIDDSYFSFSNDEFDELLLEAELKHSNSYKFGEIQGTLSEEDASNIIESINNIGKNEISLEEVQDNISNVFMTAIGVTTATQDQIAVRDRLCFGKNIIFTLIEMSITEIVLQVLSPKVMMLYALNAYFMGDIANGDFSQMNVKNLLKGLSNLISKMVKEIFEYFMKELLKFLLDEIQPLINKMLILMAKERVNYYIKLLQQLLSFSKMYHGINTQHKTFIDNVNYADIETDNVPPQV